jgi:hypothetical protein
MCVKVHGGLAAQRIVKWVGLLGIINFVLQT